MHLKRKIESEIIDWLNDPESLPLFILGARQVGKTYIVKKIASDYCKDRYVYMNFLNKDSLYEDLQNKTSPKDIISIIEYHFKIKIDDGFLLIFDEIQEMPNIKTSLKLFVENNINVKIVCLGSYLGNTINNDNYSFPVGKVQRMYLYPLNFEEFLYATQCEKYISEIHNSLETLKPMNDTIHKILLDLMHTYMIVGGMPKVVLKYLKTNDLNSLNMVKQNIYNDYRDDITKYINLNKDKLKALSIFDNIKNFLSKENKKFKLSKLNTTARYINYESAIKNLLITQIIFKLNNINKFLVPIATRIIESEFKIFYNDVGFTSLVLELNKYILKDDKDNKYTNIKGSIAENFVFSELAYILNNSNLYYYSFYKENENKELEKSIKRYEIDLVLEDIEANIIPIEIKFGTKYKNKSLNEIIKKYKPKYSIVLSSKNFSVTEQENLIKIPLYAIGFIKFINGRIELNYKK